MAKKNELDELLSKGGRVMSIGKVLKASDEVEALRAELLWAWENLSMTSQYPREGNEYDYCVVCNGPEYGHKPDCEGLKHKEAVEKMLGRKFCGREHALAFKIKESARSNNLYIMPGNPGTRFLGENI